MEVKWNYFQFRKSLDYPTYIRLRRDEAHPKFLHVLNEMGFSEITEKDSKKISLHRPHTRILTVQNASPNLNLQINGSDLLDKYGHEMLAIQAGTPVYTYRRVGMLVVPAQKTLWDMALSQDMSLTDHMVGIRVLIVRFLAAALADQGVLCYWGTVKDGTVIVMKQNQSFGESVIIDTQKKTIFSFGTETRMSSTLKLIRRDKEIAANQNMGREELISFLSVSTCLLSFSGITPIMKKMIYEMSAMTHASYGQMESQPNL